MKEMEGAADVLMVADPTTFRVLPWAPSTGWLLCDLHFADGRPVPFATRHLYRKRARSTRTARLRFRRRPRSRIPPLQARRRQHVAGAMPDSRATPPEVSLLSHGYQYLTEQRYDQMEPVLEIIRRDVLALGLPLRSVEVEFGPSQCEFTFAPTDGPRARRQHGAVSQRREADRPPPRLSRHLHVPAETAERVRLRLAPASVDRLARRAARTPSWPRTAARRLSPFGRALSRGTAAARPRLDRVHDADHQRLQALPLLFAGAGPRDLGTRQPRRHDPRARRRQRCRDAAGKPHRRARRQSLSLHGLADSLRPRRRRSRARSRPVGGYAVRDQGGAAAEDAARGGVRAARTIRSSARRWARSSSTTTSTSRTPRSSAFRPKCRTGSSANISRCFDVARSLSFVIASEAKQSSFVATGKKAGLLRRKRSSQ